MTASRSVLGSLLAFVSGSALSAQPLTFTDQTVAAGVACSHAWDIASGPQVMSSGGAAADFNNDGLQDLFVLGGYPVGGSPAARDRLFLGAGSGLFTEVAVAAGVARSHRGLGIAVGDIDRDGWIDIFITTEPGAGGHQFNMLYRNNRDGTFSDIAASAGLATAPGSTAGGGWGAAFGDYDLDGDLDLAVGDWSEPAAGNVLYRNNGDSTFTNVTAAAIGGSLVGSQGFSPRFVDTNGDRYPELLWTSDFGGSRYLVNNGNGTFSNATAPSGTGLDGNGMGTSVADFNGDGRPDWFVTSIYSPVPQTNQPGTGNMLYLNLGNHQFAEVSQAAGVKQGGWGWGSVAVDFDHDGRTDLAHTNGWPDDEFAADPTCVFRNISAGAPTVFQSVAPACGVTHNGQGRGMLNFDYDNDGDQDLVIFTNDGPLTLYRNDTPTANRYLRIFLDARATPSIAPAGQGARIVTTAGGVTRYHWILGGSNFLSQSELSADIGLGAAATVDQLRVEWPDGRVRTWTGVATNRTLILSACGADFNRDGSASVQDLFDFLAAYFSSAPAADVNISGAVSLQDIFDFLSAWFAGCV